MKLHFIASQHPQSVERFEKLIGRHGQADIADADILVVLGGDGQMLHAMREAISAIKSPYSG